MVKAVVAAILCAACQGQPAAPPPGAGSARLALGRDAASPDAGSGGAATGSGGAATGSDGAGSDGAGSAANADGEPRTRGDEPDVPDPSRVIAELGAIPAWQAVIDRSQLLGRRGQHGVVYGRVGPPVMVPAPPGTPPPSGAALPGAAPGPSAGSAGGAVPGAPAAGAGGGAAGAAGAAAGAVPGAAGAVPGAAGAVPGAAGAVPGAAAGAVPGAAGAAAGAVPGAAGAVPGAAGAAGAAAGAVPGAAGAAASSAAVPALAGIVPGAVAPSATVPALAGAVPAPAGARAPNRLVPGAAVVPVARPGAPVEPVLVASPYVWLIDDTEGNGALGIRIALGDKAKEGDRIAAGGAWQLDSDRRWFWKADAVQPLPPAAPSELKDPPAPLPNHVIAAAPLPPGARTVSLARDNDLIYFEIVGAPPVTDGDGWLVADQLGSPTALVLNLPGERPSYGGQDMRAADERWQLRRGQTYWLRIGRLHKHGDKPPSAKARTAPVRLP